MKPVFKLTAYRMVNGERHVMQTRTREGKRNANKTYENMLNAAFRVGGDVDMVEVDPKTNEQKEQQ